MMILSLSRKHLRSGFIFSFIPPVSHTSSEGGRDCSVWCHGLNYSQSVDTSVSLLTGSGSPNPALLTPVHPCSSPASLGVPGSLFGGWMFTAGESVSSPFRVFMKWLNYKATLKLLQGARASLQSGFFRRCYISTLRFLLELS